MSTFNHFYFFGNSSNSSSDESKRQRKRGRVCRVEELEGRAMLSVTPWLGVESCDNTFPCENAPVYESSLMAASSESMQASSAPWNAQARDLEVYHDLVARGLQEGNFSWLEWDGSFRNNDFAWNSDGFLIAINTSWKDLSGALDVSGLTALRWLDISHNQLTELNVSGCVLLQSERLYGVDANPLEVLNISGTAITELRIYHTSTTLKVYGGTNLTDLYVYSDSLESLDVSNCTALTSLSVGGPLASLDVSNNTALNYLSVEHNQLTSLDVSNNTALEILSVSYNQLTSLDVSNNTALEILSVSYNQLTSLDVSNNTALEILSVSNNQLTSLDVSNNTALEHLSVSDNQLTSLDLSNNTALTQLFVEHNPLEVLNISGTAITEFRIRHFTSTTLKVYGGTNLTNLFVSLSWQSQSLDVSNCTALTSLEVESGRLTSLDVSNNTALEYLSVSVYPLTTLDISNNKALKSLYVNNYQPTSLDVSNNKALTELTVYADQLTSLDVSNNTVLTELTVGRSQLTSLDLSNNTTLTHLDVRNNQLISLDVSNNTALSSERPWDFSVSGNQLTFSSLLLPANDRTYSVGNQQPTAITLTDGNIVDLSSEYLIEKEYITQYIWFYNNGDVVDSSHYTEANGIFTFTGIQDGSIIYCSMTNDRFPGWTLETTEVMISETSSPLVPPETPTGLASTSRTANSIALSWNVVANATSYEIQYRTGSEAWRSESVTETSATIAFLDSNTTYEFQVRAVNNEGMSEWSSIISVMTDTVELGTPTLMSAIATGHDTITVTWEPASNANAYRVEYSRSPIFAGISESVMIESIDGTLTTTANLTGLLANTTYYIRIIALSDNNISEWSNILHTSTDAKQLTIPTISSISVSGTTSLKVEWSSVQYADGYIITYFTGEGNAQQAISVSGNTTSAVIAVLQTGQEYTISITAIGTGEYSNSATSNSMQGTPTAQHNVPVAVNPTGVKMMNAKSAYPPTLNSISLEWRANAANVAYIVTKNATAIPTERITYITNAQGQIVGATITGLESGIPYNFTVAAYNANNEKAQRDITVRATTLAESRAIVKPRAVSSVRGIDGTGPTINTVQISWNILTSEISAYQITIKGSAPNPANSSRMLVQDLATMTISNDGIIKNIVMRDIIVNGINANPLLEAGLLQSRFVDTKNRQGALTGTALEVHGLNPGTRYTFETRMLNENGNVLQYNSRDIVSRVNASTLRYTAVKMRAQVVGKNVNLTITPPTASRIPAGATYSNYIVELYEGTGRNMSTEPIRTIEIIDSAGQVVAESMSDLAVGRYTIFVKAITVDSVTGQITESLTARTTTNVK